MPRNEYLTPAERAKKFSSGTYTARQTGARDEAARHFQNQQKMGGGIPMADTANFESYISGRKKAK